VACAADKHWRDCFVRGQRILLAWPSLIGRRVNSSGIRVPAMTGFPIINSE
jgi:hypothetical protein